MSSSSQRIGALAFVISSIGLTTAVRRLARSASTATATAAAAASVPAQQNSTQGGVVANLRKEYKQRGLDDAEAPADPFQLFSSWFKDALEAKVLEPNAMVSQYKTEGIKFISIYSIVFPIHLLLYHIYLFQSFSLHNIFIVRCNLPRQ